MKLPIQQSFEEHLKVKGLSKKSLRNYRCDLNHFLDWLRSRNKFGMTRGMTPESFLPYLSPMLVAQYKGYHLENKIRESTTNRRLSTLRNFCRFLLQQGYIGKDPTQNVSNVKRERSWQDSLQNVLEDFRQHLEDEGVSKITLKNYLSDTRQFLAWYVHETERTLDS